MRISWNFGKRIHFLIDECFQNDISEEASLTIQQIVMRNTSNDNEKKMNEILQLLLPNEFEKIFHNPLEHSQRTVCFLQLLSLIVTQENYEYYLLKCIEYGSNLAYLISAEESYLISNTLSNHLYATHYESNKKIMYEQINKVNVVLNQIKAQEIEGRYVIENGVVEVTYANGIKVYVNYTNDTYTYGDIKIPSMDYKVVS